MGTLDLDKLPRTLHCFGPWSSTIRTIRISVLNEEISGCLRHHILYRLCLEKIANETSLFAKSFPELEDLKFQFQTLEYEPGFLVPFWTALLTASELLPLLAMNDVAGVESAKYGRLIRTKEQLQDGVSEVLQYHSLSSPFLQEALFMIDEQEKFVKADSQEHESGGSA